MCFLLITIHIEALTAEEDAEQGDLKPGSALTAAGLHFTSFH